MELLVWLAPAIILVGAYIWYAAIVTRRNRVNEAMSGVDVQLTQRHDLIPNLLAIAKRFMEHEKGLLEEITALRVRAAAQASNHAFTTLDERFATETKLDAGLGRLFAVAENYPQLKSDGAMIEAQRGFREVETNISAARRFYNSAVTDLRNATQIFPGNLLAGLAGVKSPPPFFEASEAQRGPVDAAKHL